MVSIGIGLAVVLFAIAGIALWNFSTISHISSGSSELSFELPIDFAKFRAIMVRKNATNAIVAHSGMKVIEERIQDVEIDTKGDTRPILHALVGKSQSDLWARKLIVVRVHDPEIHAEQLEMTQSADIQADSMEVQTISNRAAGNLKKYETFLKATAQRHETTITVKVNLQIEVIVPKLFVANADQRVQKAADKATREQRAAIEDFIQDHAGAVIVMPEF